MYVVSVIYINDSNNALELKSVSGGKSFVGRKNENIEILLIMHTPQISGKPAFSVNLKDRNSELSELSPQFTYCCEV